MVAYYKLDEASGAVLDWSGNGRDGSAASGATYHAAGVFDYALDFDGTNDYVDLADFGLSDSFTWHGWVYADVLGGDAIVSKNTDPAIGGINGNLFGLWANANGSFTFDLCKTTFTSSTGMISAGAWHLIVLRATASGGSTSVKISTYKLGSGLVASYTGTNSVVISTAGFNFTGANTKVWSLGQEWDAARSDFWNGRICEAVWWNRVLSDVEVAALYAQGAGTHASGAPCTWLPLLRAWPDALSERVSPNGGIPESGELSLDILDGDDALCPDKLTSLLKFDAPPIAMLDGALSSSATTLTLASGAPSTLGGTFVYLGSECLYVRKQSGTTLTVLRGQLDTDAESHADAAPVFEALPSLLGRRIRLYVMPEDADSASATQALGTYHVDRIALSPDCNSWQLAGKSVLKHLHRVIGSRLPPAAFVSGVADQGTSLFLSNWAPWVDRVDPWDESAFPMLVGEELMKFFPMSVKPVVQARGLLGTPTHEIQRGSLVRPCMISDTTLGIGSFRYSATNATTRSDPSWTATDHFVDILLCLLTSSAIPGNGDSLEMTNGDASAGNWSCLQAGFGIGLPAALVDFSTFAAVKKRLPEWRLSRIIIPPDLGESFAEWASREILQPLGAYLYTTSAGKLALRVPRSPLDGESPTDTLTEADIESKPAQIKLALDTSQLASSVAYELPGPNGQPVVFRFSASDHKALFRANGFYASDERELRFKLSGLSGASGATSLLKSVALRRLARYARPLWKFSPVAGLHKYGLSPGSLIGVTISELPDTSAGTRGWTSRLLELVGTELNLAPDGSDIELELLAFPSLHQGRVCPSVAISSVSTNTITAAANRFTATDGPSDLPAKDVSGFTVNDVVGLTERDGSLTTATTQIVQSINAGANTITLDGDFGGLLASGKRLVYAPSSSATSTQRTLFVFWGSAASGAPASVGFTWSWVEA